MAAYAEPIFYDHVPDTGEIQEGVFVPVNGVESKSEATGGCGDPQCLCVNEHFFTRLFPRDDRGNVYGYVVHFDSRAELDSAPAEEIERIVRRSLH